MCICTAMYVCVRMQILCMLVMSICVSVCLVWLPMFPCRSQLNLSCCQGEKLHHPCQPSPHHRNQSDLNAFVVAHKDYLKILMGHSNTAWSHFFQLREENVGHTQISENIQLVLIK